MPGNTSAPYQLRGHIGPILTALQENNVLVDLDISYHGILNNGVRLWAQLLVISYISSFQRPINELLQAVALSKLIAANYTISTIAWDGNGTGTLGFANVKNALKRNLALRFMPVPVVDVVAVNKVPHLPLIPPTPLLFAYLCQFRMTVSHK